METAPKRYLFLIDSLIPGGAERSLVELLPPLVERGIVPILMCLNQREVGFHQEVIDGGFDLRFARARGWLGRVREINSVIRRERPNLLHTTLFEADLIGRLAAIGTGVPVMTTLANTTYDEARIAGDSNLNPRKVGLVRAVDGFTARHLTDHFHAVSEAVKKSAVRHMGLAEEKVTVVRRGRDPVRLGVRSAERTKRAREELGLGGDAEIILSVGRLEYQKGHLHLLRAFASLSEGRPAAQLVVAGREGNTSEQLRSTCTALGIQDRVHFLGHRTDVPELMAAADVFVFPSLWEGLGGVLIEALALEVPIVSSNLDATREVVGEDGSSGLLVPPGDDRALSLEIEKVLGDTDLRSRMTRNARERFESHFLLENQSKELIDLMESVAGGSAK